MSKTKAKTSPKKKAAKKAAKAPAAKRFRPTLTEYREMKAEIERLSSDLEQVCAQQNIRHTDVTVLRSQNQGFREKIKSLESHLDGANTTIRHYRKRELIRLPDTQAAITVATKLLGYKIS